MYFYIKIFINSTLVLSVFHRFGLLLFFSISEGVIQIMQINLEIEILNLCILCFGSGVFSTLGVIYISGTRALYMRTSSTTLK
jgi:hypothetical protein